MLHEESDDVMDPPDRNSDFHPSKKRKTTKKVSKVVEYVLVYMSFPLVDISLILRPRPALLSYTPSVERVVG